jgi:serine/threonine-protein kinase
MPSDDESQASLIRAEAAPTTAGGRHRSWTLPPDLLREAVRRLRASALLYAGAYFLAGLLPALLIPEARAMFFSNPGHWVPAVVSIAGGLALAGLVSYPGLSDRVKVRAGLIFEVLGSIGIAAAEYQDVSAQIQQGEMGPGGFGLSWVASWVLLFSVVVPTPPRVTVVWAALSVAAVPLVYATGVALGSNAPLPAGQFFFSLVFPYLVIVLMAYVGSRVVYGLGAEVRKAREMGSYRLVKRLGEGGMGEVWRAQHRMLARPAAIKLIRPKVLGVTDAQSRQLLKRFEREAQATALMRSPHTLELYDFGMADDGTFYYVMELLDGFDLDELIERFGPVPAERAVHFLRQVCASLAEAHDAGLIHRDIKPANLYTCRYGRDVDFIKVLDFGLVKHGGAPEPGADKLTAEHFAGGTPAFMSPEQAVAEETLDGRSDLYSLGCVAYWLLTGIAVFKGRTPIETMMMHVHVKPDPPSLYTKLFIPPELEAIVMSCLAKEVEARPQTADELSQRLAAVRIGAEWTQSRARAWWDANRPVTARVSIPV